MTGDDTARMLYLVLLLVVIGGAMLFELSGRGGRALRQIALWAVLFAGIAFAYDWWTGGGAPRQQVLEGGRIEVASGRGGHYHLEAALNGTPVHFIVDTGASSVALSREDAIRIGIDPSTLAYTGLAMTANGQVPTAGVTIEDFRLGEIHDRNVRAVVIDGDLGVSLLGMSYLSRFARVSFEGGRLILER